MELEYALEVGTYATIALKKKENTALMSPSAKWYHQHKRYYFLSNLLGVWVKNYVRQWNCPKSGLFLIRYEA